MKKYLKITIMLIIMLALATSTVSAVYQIRPNATSAVSTTADTFFYNIRKMETEGQVLGLTETINTTTGLSTEESGSNNIDCHMMKNTEYGLIAIFSASGFGDAPTGYGTTSNGGEATTTTKNKTGIYQMVNYYSTSGGNEKREYLAAVNSDIGSYSSYCGKLRNSVDKRYVDIYSSTGSSDYSSAKTGDATRETAKWYGAAYADFVNSGNPVFNRGYNGLFSFNIYYGVSHSDYSSRAVVVCGSGL